MYLNLLILFGITLALPVLLAIEKLTNSGEHHEHP